MVSSFRMIFGIIACQLGYAAASLAQTSAGPTLPFGGSAPIPVSASPVTVLYNFGATRDDAVSPTQIGLLAEGRDGSLYGTTPNGGSLGKGSNGFGTVYRIAPDGTFSVLYNFDGSHGAFPGSGLIRGADGNFYGTTNGGGKYLAGTIYKITPAGEETVLFDFRNGAVIPRPVGRPPTDQEVLDAAGSYPLSGPIQAQDGSLYGVVPTGNIQRDGVLYRISPNGDFHGLHNFHADSLNDPAGLIMGTDGNLYGSALSGSGENRFGCIFRATTSGAVTILHHFDSIDGTLSYNLMQASDGNLYGTAKLGGPGGRGLLYKLTLAGDFSILHAFNGADGASPIAGVVEGKDGFLYGVTSFGGVRTIGGDLYRIGKDGNGFAILHNFSGLGGGFPSGDMILHTNGLIYGTTGGGGKYTTGVFFSFDPTKAAMVVNAVRLGIPKMVTAGRSHSIIQNVYADGSGIGSLSGQWLVDGKSVQKISVFDLALTPGSWHKVGVYQSNPQDHHDSMNFKLQFALDGTAAPATSVEDINLTGFIPSLDGWAFENNSLRFLPTVLLLPFTGAENLWNNLKTSKDGVCEGFTQTARDYYNNLPNLPVRPLDMRETTPIDNLIFQENKDGNQWAKENTPDVIATGMGFGHTQQAYAEVLRNEAAAIRQQMSGGDPCVIDIYSFQLTEKGSTDAHSVLGAASFYATNLLWDYASNLNTKIKEMSLFSIYDPNHPGDDQRYVGSFDTEDSGLIFQFIPADHADLKLWVPSSFHHS